MIDYPALLTNRTIGQVGRYMPLGWYAFYVERDGVRYYDKPIFLDTLDVVAISPNTLYSGIHVEPSIGVEITVTIQQ